MEGRQLLSLVSEHLKHFSKLHSCLLTFIDKIVTFFCQKYDALFAGTCPTKEM